jgi:hypothetical protein
LTQVPWRDLPVQAMHSILTYPEMKVRDGKTLSNNLISYITGFQNALANHGMDTTLPVSAAFQDRLRSDGSPTEAFTLLDRFLAQLCIEMFLYWEFSLETFWVSAVSPELF